MKKSRVNHLSANNAENRRAAVALNTTWPKAAEWGLKVDFLVSLRKLNDSGDKTHLACLRRLRKTVYGNK